MGKENLSLRFTVIYFFTQKHLHLALSSPQIRNITQKKAASNKLNITIRYDLILFYVFILKLINYEVLYLAQLNTKSINRKQLKISSIHQE